MKTVFTEPGNLRKRLWPSALFRSLAVVFAAMLMVNNLMAIETPKSYEEASSFEHAKVRVPFTRNPPNIDGVMEEGEWEDATGFSGFWYDFGAGDPRHLVSYHLQPRIYWAYDKEHLYMAVDNAVYPVNSWLKARGRFPDVLGDPQYGVLWDDHVEFELRPYPDNLKGFKLGLLRWDFNVINTLVDWCWSINGGTDMKFQSGATLRCKAGGERWVAELKIPLKNLRFFNYDGKDENGEPIVKLPIPDGTKYRFWLHLGIGGNALYSLHYDKHNWNVCEGEMLFDSKAPSFQITKLGHLMDDQIDVTMKVKNHNTRSETVRVGFFVENAAGTIYSSFESDQLSDGLLELRPGEVKTVNLTKFYPGISRDGNVLWFDVRSAGTPAKVLYRTRLQSFHAMNGGRVKKGDLMIPYTERRLHPIKDMRPKRQDFKVRVEYSWYKKRASVLLDKGIHGASDEAKTATEAKITIKKNTLEEELLAETTVPFNHNFAVAIMDTPDLQDGEEAMVNVLLFDDAKRVVGERTVAWLSENSEKTFIHEEPDWMHNDIGKEDRLFGPFVEMQTTENGFETLRHKYQLTEAGLPKQIFIKADQRELPLELRGEDAEIKDDLLMEIGRGEQLHKPMRFEAVIDGKRIDAEVVKPAELVRQWKTELEYKSKLKFGKVILDLTMRYDLDGSIHAFFDYGPQGKSAKIGSLELLTQLQGRVDRLSTAMGGGGMAGVDVRECRLPMDEGVLWDSKDRDIQLYYSHFVPSMWIGSGDRAFTWLCDTDKGWGLDRNGSAMRVERDKNKNVTWRTLFVNHPQTVTEQRSVDFTIIVHPTKYKVEDVQTWNWHYCHAWADQYWTTLNKDKEDLMQEWRGNAKAPEDVSFEEVAEWQEDNQQAGVPFWKRYGNCRNTSVSPELDRRFEDRFVFLYERLIRIGRRVGGWMDEYWPGMSGSDNVATGSAYLRDAEEVQEMEIPWQKGWNSRHMRDAYKRVAKIHERENVPNRHATWANTAANMISSFIWDTMLVEDCGAMQVSREIDQLTAYPMSLYTFMGKNYTGLITHMFADMTPVSDGDDPRFDRQSLGLALTNGFGFLPDGPHGQIEHVEYGVDLLQRLDHFGFFEDKSHEFIPYWRISDYAEYKGDVEAYVSAWRTPLPNDKGYRTIFVILNYEDADVSEEFVIKDLDRFLGGNNTLTETDLVQQADAPEDLKGLWDESDSADKPVLKDFETGEIIRSVDNGKTYGPVFIPLHDYRILYAEHRTE